MSFRPHSERGAALMDIMLFVAGSVLVTSALTGAYLYAADFINDWAEEKYVAPVRKELQAEIKVAKDDAAQARKNERDALDANNKVRGEVALVRSDIEAANKTVASLGQALVQARAARPAEDKARNAELAKQNFDLLAALSAPDPGGKCEDRMARIDANLRKLGADSLLFNPPTAGAAPAGNRGGTGAASGNQRPGPDALRLGR